MPGEKQNKVESKAKKTKQIPLKCNTAVKIEAGIYVIPDSQSQCTQVFEWQNRENCYCLFGEVLIKISVEDKCCRYSHEKKNSIQ